MTESAESASTGHRPIVQIVQRLAPGGIEQLVLEFERQTALDMETVLISLEGSRDSLTAAWPRLSALGDRLIGLDKAPGFQPGTLLRLIRLMRRLRPAAVHTHHVGPLLYGGLAARLSGVRRLVHTEHDAWHLRSRKRRALVGALFATLRPNLVACGADVAAAIARALPGTDAQIIANGVDTTRFVPSSQAACRRELGLPLDGTLVGAAGRLETVKGHDQLITALSLMPPGIALAIAGDGSQRDALESLARTLGVGQRVHFLGMLGDTAAFYPALNLYCLPSRNEGLPLSLLEAQACGVPAVATDVGSVREALCPRTGRLVPPGRPDLLATALMAGLDAAAPAAARSFVQTHFDLARTIGAYRELLAA